MADTNVPQLSPEQLAALHAAVYGQMPMSASQLPDTGAPSAEVQRKLDEANYSPEQKLLQSYTAQHPFWGRAFNVGAGANSEMEKAMNAAANLVHPVAGANEAIEAQNPSYGGWGTVGKTAGGFGAGAPVMLAAPLGVPTLIAAGGVYGGTMGAGEARGEAADIRASGQKFTPAQEAMLMAKRGGTDAFLSMAAPELARGASALMPEAEGGLGQLFQKPLAGATGTAAATALTGNVPTVGDIVKGAITNHPMEAGEVPMEKPTTPAAEAIPQQKAQSGVEQILSEPPKFTEGENGASQPGGFGTRNNVPVSPAAQAPPAQSVRGAVGDEFAENLGARHAAEANQEQAPSPYKTLPSLPEQANAWSAAELKDWGEKVGYRDLPNDKAAIIDKVKTDAGKLTGNPEHGDLVNNPGNTPEAATRLLQQAGIDHPSPQQIAAMQGSVEQYAGIKKAEIIGENAAPKERGAPITPPSALDRITNKALNLWHRTISPNTGGGAEVISRGERAAQADRLAINAEFRPHIEAAEGMSEDECIRNIDTVSKTGQAVSPVVQDAVGSLHKIQAKLKQSAEMEGINTDQWSLDHIGLSAAVRPADMPIDVFQDKVRAATSGIMGAEKWNQAHDLPSFEAVANALRGQGIPIDKNPVRIMARGAAKMANSLNWRASLRQAAKEGTNATVIPLDAPLPNGRYELPAAVAHDQAFTTAINGKPGRIVVDGSLRGAMENSFQNGSPDNLGYSMAMGGRKLQTLVDTVNLSRAPIAWMATHGIPTSLAKAQALKESFTMANKALNGTLNEWDENPVMSSYAKTMRSLITDGHMMEHALPSGEVVTRGEKNAAVEAAKSAAGIGARVARVAKLTHLLDIGRKIEQDPNLTPEAKIAKLKSTVAAADLWFGRGATDLSLPPGMTRSLQQIAPFLKMTTDGFKIIGKAVTDPFTQNAGGKSVMAKTLAAGLGTILISGAVRNYYNTGQWPRSIQDALEPQTGTHNEDGSAQREKSMSSLAGVIDTIEDIAHGEPGAAVSRITGPSIATAAAQAWTGRDYRGNPETPMQRFTNFFGTAFPFLPRLGRQSEGVGVFNQIMGTRPVSGTEDSTPFMNHALDVLRAHTPPEDADELASGEQRTQWRDAMSTPALATKNTDSVIQQMQQAGYDDKQINSFLDDAGAPHDATWMASKMEPQYMAGIWKDATPDERHMMRGIIEYRIAHADTDRESPATRQGWNSLAGELGSTVKEDRDYGKRG